MSPERKPPQPRDKARNLLLRFPITDLARAVASSDVARRAILRQFVETSTPLNYVPTRNACELIYGVQKPLIETPLEPWERIERYIRAASETYTLDMNLVATHHLFDLIRPKGYTATHCEPQILRVSLKQIVHIGLEYYITEGERLIFQFPHPRIDGLTDGAATVLGSVIHHAYAQGDYAEADVEIADVGRLPGAPPKDARASRIHLIERSSIMPLDRLNAQIEEVYAILRELATRPKTTKD